MAKDAAGAADMLLRGVASDSGEARNQLTQRAANWSVDTIRATQALLQEAGFYDGAIDGVSGPRFAAALGRWREGGFVNAMSGG